MPASKFKDQGVADSRANITIIGVDLFRQVAAVARLQKRDLKKVDRVPKTYNLQPFSLDCKIDLDISFGNTTMKTPVYAKMTHQNHCFSLRVFVISWRLLPTTLIFYHITSHTLEQLWTLGQESHKFHL